MIVISEFTDKVRCMYVWPIVYKINHVTGARDSRPVFDVVFIFRHVFWLNVHPDFIFLMYFLRCQLTVTVMLILVLGPKVRHRILRKT